MKYYIITNRHTNIFGENWILFWRKNNCGYTVDFRAAGIYKKADFPIINNKEEYYKKAKKLDDFCVPVNLIKKEFEEFHLIEG